MTARPLRRPLLLALALAVAACTACGSSSGAKSGPAPVSTGADGGKVYAPPGGHYRVELPSGWVTIDAATMSSSSGLAKVKANNPKLARSFDAFAQLARQPGVLVAFDRTSAGSSVADSTGFSANIIVRRLPLNSSKSDRALLASLVSAGQANLGANPAVTGTPSVSRLTVAGLPAAVVTYSVLENTAKGKTNVTESDYVTVRDGTAYTLYCTTATSDVTRFHPVCEHALSSFSITG
ncbi:MAG: hypothetical protein ACTHNU_09425 [Gaiellales bacterium]